MQKKEIKKTLILAAIIAAGIAIFSSMMYVLMMISYILGTW